MDNISIVLRNLIRKHKEDDVQGAYIESVLREHFGAIGPVLSVDWRGTTVYASCTSPVLAHEIKLREKDILGSINSHLGQMKFQKIVCTIGPLRNGSKRIK